MIAEKKKQLQTLLALVGLLIVVAAYTYWTNRTPTTGVAATTSAKAARAALLPSQGNAEIRLDLIRDKLDNSGVGRRNVFQYYVPPPAPKPPPPTVSSYVPPRTVVDSGPPRPIVQPPPFSALSTFKYDAVVIAAKPEKTRASIKEGETGRYNVYEGEYILGRYRINKITENTVEIEDVDQNRRQTYTRLTQ